MMNCENITRLISESQDRTLSLTEKINLKMHVVMCAGCKNFSLQVPFLSQAMKAYAKGYDEVQDDEVKK
ncbi:MAG: zf-HC2 domain-containing protein [Rhodoferax sp.]|nr:zf-HC2 domain-containing protein [Rhodoferax sp.]